MNKFFNVKSGFSKILFSGIIMSSLLLNSQPAWTAAINDIDESSHYARESIIALAEQGIITGDQQGNFNPHDIITRSEMVKILVNVLGIDTADVPQKPSFTDVPATHWSYRYVEAAYREGIIKGLPDGSFGKNQELTREQMAAMLVRSVGLTDQILAYGQEFTGVNKLEDKEKIANWARGSIDFVLSAELMKGTDSDSFLPKAGAERQQAAIVANRFMTNKTEILKQAETILAQVRVILNGDAINPGDKAFEDNGEIYVPVVFFEAMGAETYVDSSMNTARISRKLSDGAEKSISFSKGSSNGLKVVDNEAYVPLEAAVQALGADVQREANSGTVFINDDETVKYPNLYNAINEGMNFKGNFSSTAVIVMKDIMPDSIMEIDFDIDGTINGDDYRTSYKITPKIDGIPDASQNVDITKVGEKVYVKMDGIDEWVETNVEELEDSGLIPAVDPAGMGSDSNLVTSDEYNLYNINRVGSVTVGEETAVKYVLTVDEAALREKISKTKPEDYSEADELLNAGMDIEIEIYVNKDGQIVRETLSYGMIAEENGNVNVTVKLDRSYSDIGKDIKIIAPEAISGLTLEDILNGSF